MGGGMKNLLSLVASTALLAGCADVSMPAYRQPETPAKAVGAAAAGKATSPAASAAIKGFMGGSFRVDESTETMNGA